MKISNVWAENFMSITDTQVNVSDTGLVLIQGDNSDSDAFESNGAGKSTVFTETIVWALFGETIRGQKGDKVINRTAGKDTRVALEVIDDNGDVYLIERHRKHKQHKNHVLMHRNGDNITGKSDTETNAMIVDLLQMDYSTFTNSIMFGQGVTKMFANATDSEQKKILENMLQIDIYKACQDVAKVKLNETNMRITSLQGQIDLDRNSVETTQKAIDHAQEMEAKLEQQVNEKIAELEEEFAEYTKELQSLPDVMSLDEEAQAYHKLIKKLDEKLAGFKQYEESKEDLISDKKSLQRDMDRIRKNQDTYREELVGIESGELVPDKCEACGQDLPLEDTTHIENHLKENIKKLGMEWQEKKDEIAEIDVLLEKLYDVLKGKDSLEEQKKDLEKGINAIEKEMALSISRDKQITKAQEGILKQIDEQKARLEQTYGEFIEKSIEMVNEVKERLKANEGEMEALNELHSQYEFWVNAYGNQGIKSVMLDSVTPFLNERANEYLNVLADSSIEVRFNTQKTLKNGEKRDQFSVEVTNHNGDTEYKGNSGGEKRRIDVAVNMALQDLVLSRSNKRIDLIVYDEVFESLDAIGSEAVIQLLKQKAKEVGSVLVITHSESLKQLFNKSLVVRKESARTVVVEGE